MKNNIIITTRKEDSGHGVRYCEVKGTKWFNRCALPEHTKLNKGDVFNIYRREYKTDQAGNITEWICDVKHGCEYDGHSLKTSLASADADLEAYYTSSTYRDLVATGEYYDMQPLNN